MSLEASLTELEAACAVPGFDVAVTSAGTVVVVWRKDGDVVARMGLRTVDDEPAVLVFLSLVVEPAYQDQGFFKALCASMPPFARDAGFDEFRIAGTSSVQSAQTFSAAGFDGDPLVVDVTADPCPIEVYAGQ